MVYSEYVHTTAGRIVRLIVGLGLIGWGYVSLPGTTGIILIVVGIVGPLAAGAFHLCSISALLGGPIRGARIAKGKPQ